MKRIIYDCDNTFGIKDCDVDDGLALIYLLGSKEAELLGVSTTYGNNRTDVVFENTKRMLRDLGRTDIPLKKGGLSKGDYNSEAADFLVETAQHFKGELSILATGSMTNLGAAYKKDRNFFKNVKEIVMMGGITSPLVFEKKIMDELNLSCDPEASEDILINGKNVSVITGNNCTKVLFEKSEYRKILMDSDKKIASYILSETDSYFSYNDDCYGIKGFYNWDVTAAVYLMHPELFYDRIGSFNIKTDDLNTGFLRCENPGNCMLNLPEVKETASFKDSIYKTWFGVEM